MSQKLGLDTSATVTQVQWTPTFAFSAPGTSSLASVTADGLYQRIGNLVLFDLRYTATPTLGTASGVAQLGLPLPIGAPLPSSIIIGPTNGGCEVLSGITPPANSISIFPSGGTSGGSTTTLVALLNTGAVTPFGPSNFTTGTPFTIRVGGRYYTT